MLNSIQQFIETGIPKLETVEKKFFKSKDITDLETGTLDEMMKFGRDLITEVLEYYDSEIKNYYERKRKWDVVRTDTKHLVTALGEISYHKTLYKNKETGERTYLLDRALHLEKHMRMTDLAESKILEEAVQTSYRKGGESVSPCDKVSKSAVKDKIQDLDFTKVKPVAPAKKREAKLLYIDADEDHVSLQFHDHKGDLKANGAYRKDNCLITKMIYVYEGIEPEAPKSARSQLIHPHYFCGTYGGKANEELWQEVYDYIETTYDLSKIEKVYLNSDGGAWIKGAGNRLHGITKVLDEFHINKYLLKMTGGLLDSADDTRQDLIKAIKKGTKEEFGRLAEKIINVTESESSQVRIADAANYILNNWEAARVRLQRGKDLVGCSAEGHVSHILSDRMSSRPLGWSTTGADNMAHLRAYYYNHGNMLTLVRSQRLPKAAGAEDEIFLDPKKAEADAETKDWGKYFDRAQHQVSAEVQKIAWLSGGIDFI